MIFMWNRFCCFFLYIFVCIYVLCAGRLLADIPGLYKADDKVVVLNEENFSSLFFNQKHFWILQLYNSYCGHCVKYSSTFKEFASEIQLWGTIVQAAVVNCADEANVAFQRRYNVEAFPTLRFFTPEVKDYSDTGENMKVEYASNLLRQQLIDTLERAALNNTQRFASLLTLFTPYSDDLSLLWNEPRFRKVKTILIVMESPASYVGRELILDFSGVTTVKVIRILTGNVKYAHLSPMQENHVSLFEYRKGDDIKLLHTALESEARSEFHGMLEARSLLPSTKIIAPVLPGPEIKNNGDLDHHQGNNDMSAGGSAKFHSDRVYMVDLENAIARTLRQEIAGKAKFNSTDVTVLKHFFKAVAENVPFRSQVRDAITKLGEELGDGMSGEEFEKMVKRNKNLPHEGEYAACRGSKTGFRGYPCSLWTLMHTVTVNAYKRYLDDNSIDPLESLFAMREYIVHFFTCGDCRQHFTQLSRDIKTEAKLPTDSVMWLWNAHNMVRKRLRHSITEDALFPKIPFPSKTICPLCHKSDSTDDRPLFDRKNVLEYLMNVYNPDNIIGAPAHWSARLESGGGLKRFMSNLDISLYVFWWLVSVALICAIFGVVMMRRRRYRLFDSVFYKRLHSV